MMFTLWIRFIILFLWQFYVICDCMDPFRAIPGGIKFIHCALSIQPSPGKGDGVFVTKNTSIPMGTVLIVEDPLIDTSFQFESQQIHSVVIADRTTLLRTNDKDRGTFCITHTLDSMCISEPHLQNARQLARRLKGEDSKEKKEKSMKCTLTELQINDIARFYTNAIGECLHQFCNKINHGFPTNVAMAHIQVPKHRTSDSIESKRRLVVFATKQLHFGEELQFDYFGVLDPKGSMRYKQSATRFGIDILGTEPFCDKRCRDLVDKLGIEYNDERGAMGAGVILDEIIRSGLVFKIFSNGFHPSLLFMAQQDGGRLVHILKASAASCGFKNGQVRWDMFSMDAWERYGKSSLGKTSPVAIMGGEYCSTMEELRWLEECQ